MATLAPDIETRAKSLPWSKIFLLAGLAALCLPSLVSLAQQSWSRDEGVHGPIVLATGVWLIWREWKTIVQERESGNIWLTLAVLIPSLVVYAGARALDYLSLEIAALVGVLVATFYAHFGAKIVKRLWFPIVYLCFLIPPPGWAIDIATASLKTLVSQISLIILEVTGYPVTRIGVTLYVAQYQLLVEDACSGMNSIVSLTSISLFYIYLMHAASWRYALFLMFWILPIAILANIIRVLILVLLTYHFGNEAAQGFLHNTAGMVMFVTALLGIFAIDQLCYTIFHRFFPEKA